MKMKKIKVSGECFVGKLEELDGALVLKNGMKVKTKEDWKKIFSSYYKKKNLGELETFRFGGCVQYEVSKFSKSQLLEKKIAKLNMRLAKQTAQSKNENLEFDSLMGK